MSDEVCLEMYDGQMFCQREFGEPTPDCYVSQGEWHRNHGELARVTCAGCRDRVRAMAACLPGAAVEVVVTDVAPLRAQIVDRLYAFVQQRIQQHQRMPPEWSSERREAACLALGALARDLADAVRDVGAYAPSREELAALRSLRPSLVGHRALPALERLLAVYGGGGE